MSALVSGVRRLVTPALTRGRQQWGRRVVNWTPEFMGFGNILYLWAWAHAHRDRRPPHQVLVTEKMRPWIPVFPAASEFLVESAAVGFWDQRVHAWATPEAHSGDPRGFTEESRAAFVREVLLTSPQLSGLSDSPLAAPDVLTVNVRRGDYYSNPVHRPEFAIDLAAYLRLAVERALVEGPVSRIHVVSDDLAWCREQLAWLTEHAPEAAVTYPGPSDGPVDNFRDLCGSRRLVISNSTFSLWGAFVAQEVHPDTSVWAPAFFQRRYGPGRCYEYDADWNFVDELPDGWQPAWVLGGS